MKQFEDFQVMPVKKLSYTEGNNSYSLTNLRTQFLRNLKTAKTYETSCKLFRGQEIIGTILNLSLEYLWFRLTMAEKSEESIEDLSSQFDASFNVTKKLNDVQKPHPRYALYKSKGTTGLQEKRRQKLLEDQKKRRDDFLLIAREIASGDIENDESFEDQDDFFDEEDEIESMDVCGKYRLRKRFKNQLMESEWLVDIPKDLDKNYILVPVPEGRRAFIITGYGETYHYSR